MRPLLPPPKPRPRICRGGVFLPYRGVSPLVWKTIQLINEDRKKEMHILKTPDTVQLSQFEVYEALAIAIKRSTGRRLAHIVRVDVMDVSEIGSEDHKDLTITVTLKDASCDNI